MKFAPIIKSTERLLSNNAPAILTGGAVVGVIATGYLAVRGGFRAQETVFGENVSRQRMADDWDEAVLLTAKESFKLTWTKFIPAVGAGAATIACVVCANRISTKRAAAIAAAYTLSESKLKDYKKAIEEKLGIETKKDVDEHVNKQQMERAVPIEKQPQRPIIIAGDKQLFFDVYSGRYFEASMEDLRSAENDLNYKVIQDMEAPLSEFYDIIGLPKIAMGDDWGWNAGCHPEFRYSPHIDDEKGRACIMIDFDVEPLRGWHHLES